MRRQSPHSCHKPQYFSLPFCKILKKMVAVSPRKKATHLQLFLRCRSTLAFHPQSKSHFSYHDFLNMLAVPPTHPRASLPRAILKQSQFFLSACLFSTFSIKKHAHSLHHDPHDMARIQSLHNIFPRPRCLLECLVPLCIYTTHQAL